MEYLFYLAALGLCVFIGYGVGYERGKWEGKNGYEKGE